MLPLCTNFKKVWCQKDLIWLLKNLPINILPSFQNLTVNVKNIHSISVRGPKIWNEFLTNEEK